MTIEELAGELAPQIGLDWDETEAVLIELVDELLRGDDASEVFGVVQVAELKPTERFAKQLREQMLQRLGGAA